ncbi:WRKY transcription factor [Orobanche gracilis]
MDDDWDLHAVVRGCAAVTTTSPSSPATNTTSGGVQLSGFQQDFKFPSAEDCFQDLLFEPPPRRKSFLAAGQELHELYKPFIFKSSDSSRIIFSPRNSPIINSQLSVFGGFRDPSSEQQQIVQKLPQKQQPFCFDNGSRNNFSHNPSLRSKKRKTHMKRVCHLAAENLSSDVWCWRKYGQKPIKGSPYPRSYYRCSTSKGCLARKQVEQNRSEPGMFIVTYTAEHNHPTPTHRNSLAGSTRQKHVETRAPNSDDLGRVLCSPETSSAASPSAAHEKLEGSRENLGGAEDDDNDDGVSVSKMEPEDDFFAGLEDFNVPDARGRTSVDFTANLEFSWLSCSATTIAGGG